MFFVGSWDQFVRIFAYMLAILFLLLMSLVTDVRRLRWLFRSLALLFVVQLVMVLVFVFRVPEYLPFVQTWLLTGALLFVVFAAARALMAVGLRF